MQTYNNIINSRPMNGEDNRFFTIPESDPFLDVFMSDKNAHYHCDFEDDRPFDLSLFKSEEDGVHGQHHPNGVRPPDIRPRKISGRIVTQEQQKQLQTKKKMKNTYASKIAKLIHQDDIQIETLDDFPVPSSIRDCSKEGQHSNLESGSPEDLKEDKLLKNRLSAQKSRKMKKQYMEKLEERVEELEMELDKARKLNQKNAEHIKKYCNNQSIINGYIVTKQQIFEKIEKLIQSGTKIQEQEINMHIDSLRLRFGATGKQRTTLISYYFKQILDIMIPDVHKYMLFTAEKSCDIFNDQRNPEDISQLYKMLGLPPKDKNKLNALYRQTLLNERRTISNTLNDLFAVKEKLDRQIRRIENLFDEIRKFVPPIGLSKFLICLEKNKYRKDVSRVWNYWEQVIEEHLDKSSEVIRKQVKKESQE